MATDDFFRSRLDQMIDLRHPLAVLATRLPWAAIQAAVRECNRLDTLHILLRTGAVQQIRFLEVGNLLVPGSRDRLRRLASRREIPS